MTYLISHVIYLNNIHKLFMNHHNGLEEIMYYPEIFLKQS